MSARAVVLFAHGSRDPLWRAPIEAVATAMRQQSPQVPVACAYLELCEPDLPTAAAALVAAGATQVTVVPLFLGTGKHAREDLPLIVQALRQTHDGVAFDLRPAVGEDPRLTAAIARIALE